MSLWRTKDGKVPSARVETAAFQLGHRSKEGKELGSKVPNPGVWSHFLPGGPTGCVPFGTILESREKY
jgi:hypothetical protein